GPPDGAALGGPRRPGGEEGDEAVPEVGGRPGLRPPGPAHRAGAPAGAARRGGDPRPDGSVPCPVPRRARGVAQRYLLRRVDTAEHDPAQEVSLDSIQREREGQRARSRKVSVADRGRSIASGSTSGPRARDPSPCWAASRYRWCAIGSGSSCGWSAAVTSCALCRDRVKPGHWPAASATGVTCSHGAPPRSRVSSRSPGRCPDSCGRAYGTVRSSIPASCRPSHTEAIVSGYASCGPSPNQRAPSTLVGRCRCTPSRGQTSSKPVLGVIVTCSTASTTPSTCSAVQVSVTSSPA